MPTTAMAQRQGTSNGDELCSTCASLQLTPRQFVLLPGDPDYPYRSETKDPTDLGNLEAMSQRKSCPLCQFIYATLKGQIIEKQAGRTPTEDAVKARAAIRVNFSWKQPYEVYPTFGDEEGEHGYYGPTGPFIRYLNLLPYLPEDGTDYVDIYMPSCGIHLVENDLPETVPPVPPVERHLLTRLRKPNAIDFDLVRQWITECKARHRRTCCLYTQKTLDSLEHHSYHPADMVPEFRCIDVGLHCLAIVPSGTLYAALSYVWGTQPCYRTVRVDVARNEQPGAFAVMGSGYNDLPQTIRDAMYAAREMGIQYLWVDSVCIVQDDDDVRQKTIQSMHMVYCAADVVLVAAGSQQAHAGISGVRPLAEGDHGAGQERGPHEKIRPRQNILELATGFRLAEGSGWAGNEGEYYSRGWTMQEAHFATRSVIFRDGQATFRCRCIGIQQEVKEDDPLGKWDRYEDNNEMRELGTPRYDLISEYTKRKLTRIDDVYHAFTGIAREIAVKYSSEFCHGLPTRFIDNALLWQPLRDPGIRYAPGTIGVCGPSWSWSGWRGKVYYLFHSDTRAWTDDKHLMAKRMRAGSWIAWYQREQHASTKCTPLVRHRYGPCDDDDSGIEAAFQLEQHFSGLDCSQTEPTAVVLGASHGAWPSTYIKDTLSRYPGSGFLQFWTVSIRLTMDEEKFTRRLSGGHMLCELLGRSGAYVGSISVHPNWLKQQDSTNGGGLLPQVREFIILCQYNDKLQLMLIEWVAPDCKRWTSGRIGPVAPGMETKEAGSAYAERVAIGSLDIGMVGEALDGGPEWKEIILG